MPLSRRDRLRRDSRRRVSKMMMRGVDVEGFKMHVAAITVAALRHRSRSIGLR